MELCQMSPWIVPTSVDDLMFLLQVIQSLYNLVMEERERRGRREGRGGREEEGGKKREGRERGRKRERRGDSYNIDNGGWRPAGPGREGS